jgi:hypothetical protein
MYNPLLEAIINFLKNTGGKAYWIWISGLLIIGFFYGDLFSQYGFEKTKVFLAILILYWVIGIPIVYIIERKGKK